MVTDLDLPGNTGGFDLGQQIRNARFEPGDRVIVLAENGYDGPVGPVNPEYGMAGCFGRVVPSDHFTDPDFITVVIQGSIHGPTAHATASAWIFYSWELAHAD